MPFASWSASIYPYSYNAYMQCRIYGSGLQSSIPLLLYPQSLAVPLYWHIYTCRHISDNHDNCLEIRDLVRHPQSLARFAGATPPNLNSVSARNHWAPALRKHVCCQLSHRPLLCGTLSWGFMVNAVWLVHGETEISILATA